MLRKKKSLTGSQKRGPFANARDGEPLLSIAGRILTKDGEFLKWIPREDFEIKQHDDILKELKDRAEDRAAPAPDVSDAGRGAVMPRKKKSPTSSPKRGPLANAQIGAGKALTVPLKEALRMLQEVLVRKHPIQKFFWKLKKPEILEEQLTRWRGLVVLYAWTSPQPPDDFYFTPSGKPSETLEELDYLTAVLVEYTDYFKLDGGITLSELLLKIKLVGASRNPNACLYGNVPTIEELRKLAEEADKVVRKIEDKVKAYFDDKFYGRTANPVKTQAATPTAQAAKGAESEVITNPKSRFKFKAGQVLFDDHDLRLPTGLTHEVLRKLVNNFGEGVPYKVLYSQSAECEAADKLRDAIAKIRRAFKLVKKFPYEVKALRRESYILRPRSR